jgi:hypothetical protein
MKALLVILVFTTKGVTIDNTQMETVEQCEQVKEYLVDIYAEELSNSKAVKIQCAPYLVKE